MARFAQPSKGSAVVRATAAGASTGGGAKQAGSEAGLRAGVGREGYLRSMGSRGGRRRSGDLDRGRTDACVGDFDVDRHAMRWLMTGLAIELEKVGFGGSKASIRPPLRGARLGGVFGLHGLDESPQNPLDGGRFRHVTLLPRGCAGATSRGSPYSRGGCESI